jgi:hypothetical protein
MECRVLGTEKKEGRKEGEEEGSGRGVELQITNLREF